MSHTTIWGIVTVWLTLTMWQATTCLKLFANCTFSMKFSLFKKKSRHGQAGVTVSDATSSSTPNSNISHGLHPVDSEILVQGEDPIIAEWVPSCLTDTPPWLLSKVSFLFTACVVTVETVGPRTTYVGPKNCYQRRSLYPTPVFSHWDTMQT